MMILTALLPVLLVTLASAGPITARDQEEEEGLDIWGSTPVVRLEWKGDRSKCLAVESQDSVTKVILKDCEWAGTDAGWKFVPGTPSAVVHAELGLCLTGGDEVQVQACNTGDDGLHGLQLWVYTAGDDVHLAQFDKGTCLDLKDGDADGSLQTYSCYEYNDNQMWYAS